MQLSIKHFLFYFFFLFSVASASAQWLEPFSPNLPSENYFYEESAEKDIFSQDFFFAMNYYSFSGDFLTNVFSQNNLLNDNALLLPPGTTMPNAPTIAGIPLGNGVLYLAIIALLYLSLLFIKKQKMQMKKISLLLVLFVFCSISGYAQPPLKAIPDNAFVLPGSGSVKLDILNNDELGACSKASIAIGLIHPVTRLTVSLMTTNKGGAVSINSDNTIAYTPTSGFIGQDSLHYKIICGGTSSSDSVLVLINVTDKPDNIKDVCSVPIVGSPWSIANPVLSNSSVCNQIPIVVGDLNGDGKSEIITFDDYTGLPSLRVCLTLKIFSSEGSLLKAITLPNGHGAAIDATGVVGLIKLPPEEISGVIHQKSLIVVASSDLYLYAYAVEDGMDITTMSNTPYWKSNVPYWNYWFANIGFADFNQDGMPEIHVGRNVFNASTGKLLATATEGSSWAAAPTHNSFLTYSALALHQMAADVLGLGNPQLILGNEIHQVNINDTTGNNNAVNNILLLRSATADNGGTPTRDGHVSIADFDNDGHLDILISNKNGDNISFYLWNPAKNTVSPTKTLTGGINSTVKNIPMLGDIDGDGKIEIVLIANPSQLMTFKYDPSLSDPFSLFWDLTINDLSASTGLTLFDFNQDGIAEILYRDTQQFRIINGSGKSHLTGNDTIQSGFPVIYNLASFSCVSGTGTEYPIIADLSGNGEAEIVITGNNATSGGDKIFIFKSGALAWAPAKRVWNQYAYNPVYVNDDLSIVKNPISPATFFVDKNGNRHQPYNNFLQQATLFNDEGKMLSLGPDLAFDEDYGTNGAAFTVSGNNYLVNIWVRNEGDASFPSPLTVSAYGFTGTEFVKLSVSPISITIPDGSIGVGETEQLIFTITGAVANFIPTNIQLRLNESNNVFPVTMEECRYWNNYYNRDLWGAPEQVLCEGDSTVYFYPLNSPLDYVWWTHPTSVASTNFLEMNKGQLSNSDLFTKDGTAIQSLYVDVYESASKRTTSRVEVKVYLHPDSLIWTGAGGTQDWHDAANWVNPDPLSPTALLPQTWIPRPCTNVLIPDGIHIYPDLRPTATNRMVYWDAACNNIHFEFGGEVARTDSLHYSKAFVQYNFGYYDSGNNLEINDGYENINNPSHLERNRWYALAAPLKKMVTGDFSFGGKPHTWQQGFVASNTSGTWTGNWELPENTNDLKLDESLNYAIALWAAGNLPEIGAENSQGYQNGLNALDGVLTIPYFQGSDEDAYDKGPHRIHKYDNGTSYFKYYWQYMPNVPLAGDSYPIGSIARGDEAYRFIFDKQVVNVGGKNTFKISVPARKEIMIGNPFMSTLNFDAFYAHNTAAKIGSIYYRLFEDEVWTEYIYGTNTLIAPLQGFFLQTAGTAGTTIDLEFPFEDVSITRPTGTEHLLKSSSEEENHLYITATNKGKSNSIQLILGENNENNIYKLFNPEAELTPQIYFTDENHQKNAIQFVNNSTKKEIPLGLSLPAGHRVDLSFSNLENLSMESLYLLDKQTGIRQDLFNNPTYTFLHADMNDYTDRFVLEVGAYNPTYIDHIQKGNNSINVYQTNESITISAKEKINRIELFDIKGQKIQEINNINNTIYQINLNLSTGIYLIKTILMNGESQTDKISIR